LKEFLFSLFRFNNKWWWWWRWRWWWWW